MARHPLPGAAVTASLAVAFLLGVALPAAPNDCLPGGRAATLLFPYFEVDLDDPFNLTTLISVNSAWDINARVVLWTDWAIPTLTFDLSLDGTDIQTLNLRDLFAGAIPQTSGGHPCSSTSNRPLTAEETAQLVAYHTGVAGPLDTRCAGANHGDRVARGFITVDVIDDCFRVEMRTQTREPVYTPVDPLDLPYFDNGLYTGVAKNDYALWGDLVFIDVNNAAAQGSEAVGIWADRGRFDGTGIYTFYGRFKGWDGRDDRVPLPDSMLSRFLNSGPFAGGADLIVWRDPGVPAANPVPCGAQPGWVPLSGVIRYDGEDGGSLVDSPFLSNDSFPLATQKVSVNELADSLGNPVGQTFGYVYLNGGSFGSVNPRQVWLLSTLRAGGAFSAAWNGTVYATLCDRTPP